MNRHPDMTRVARLVCLLALPALGSCTDAPESPEVARPNIVLIMSDDQGWGETGYYGHPVVQTPVLDDLASKGLRLDRFYAAAPLCSPTRASVLTGRHPNRSGAFRPNFSTRPEEVTIAQVLKEAGYRTGHFGKWHVGAVKAASPVNPARMGFDEYLSHDNFFEMNPPLSRNGADPEIVEGESSEIIVDAASEFVRRAVDEDEPFFVLIWFGSPHSPYSGKPEDVAAYADVEGEDLALRFTEITAMDRAIGEFRETLSELGVSENTLLWFTSDNGITTEGIPEPQWSGLYNGPWRGTKGTLWEGGVRVPAIIEWPSVIREPRRSSFPVVSSDIFPTLLDLLGLASPVSERPIDGISVRALIEGDTATTRARPIGFWAYDDAPERDNARWIDAELARGTTPTVRNPGIDFLNFVHPVPRTADYGGVAAWTGDRYKLITRAGPEGVRQTELYDLQEDPGEEIDVADEHPDLVARLTAELQAWQGSVEQSLSGADYR